MSLSSLVKVKMRLRRLRRLRSDRQETHLFASGGSANQTYPFDSTQRLSCCYNSKASEGLWPVPCEAKILISKYWKILKGFWFSRANRTLQEFQALVWTIFSAAFWCRPLFLGTLVKQSQCGHSGHILTSARVTWRQRLSYLQSLSKPLSHFSLDATLLYNFFILWHAMEEVVEGTTTVKADCSLVSLDSFLRMWKDTVYCLRTKAVELYNTIT